MAETAASDLPAQLVQDFHGAFGDRHARAVHAKGVILEGSFEPSPDAPSLSNAQLFTGRRAVTVRFSVSGTNARSGSSSTNASGQARFCYVGRKAGVDSIAAFADFNGNEFQDAGEPADTASVTWTRT